MRLASLFSPLSPPRVFAPPPPPPRRDETRAHLPRRPTATTALPPSRECARAHTPDRCPDRLTSTNPRSRPPNVRLDAPLRRLARGARRARAGNVRFPRLRPRPGAHGAVEDVERRPMDAQPRPRSNATDRRRRWWRSRGRDATRRRRFRARSPRTRIFFAR